MGGGGGNSCCVMGMFTGAVAACTVKIGTMGTPSISTSDSIDKLTF
jgi:hypothetical protein